MTNYSDNKIRTEADQEATTVEGNKREPADNTNSPANAVHPFDNQVLTSGETHSATTTIRTKERSIMHDKITR